MRSTGTVTYVGKDIALHLWKFGLLERDFRYRTFPRTAGWRRSVDHDNERRTIASAPHFGVPTNFYNVIDSRQAYPQEVVVGGLRALGYVARRIIRNTSIIRLVALTPRCAQELGYDS